MASPLDDGFAPGDLPRQLAEARAALAEADRELVRLRGRVRRLELFSEQNAGLIVIHDARGRILDANAWTCRVLGYSVEQLRDRTMMDLEVSLRDIETRFVLRNWEAMKPGARVAARGHYIRQDASTFPVEMSIGAFEADGERRFTVVATDITDRERAEKAVRESEQRFRFVFEGSPVGMFRLDPRGALLQANRAFLETLGYSARGLRRKPLAELASPAHREIVARNLARLSGRGTPSVRMEVRLVARDGAEVWLQIAVFADYGPQGELRQAIGVGEDISERKRTEQRLEQLLKSREAEITARTSDLRKANERLAEALAEAKRANQAKQRFLANISHEIRTPLNAIMGMAEFLVETELGPDQREYATTIQTSGAHLLTLINDILDFSKIEARKLQLEARQFELDHCIESAFDMITGAAATKGLQLRYTVAPGTPLAVVGDELRVRQILVNLLSNAVKFTEEGRIEVEVEPGDEPGALRFGVRDTGIGVPPGAIEHLLGAFTQLDASTTRRFGGTGLGLSICKLLCRLMDGEIWVESAGVPGQGSTFLFTLRCGVAAGERSVHLKEGASALRGRRVLLVGHQPVQLGGVAGWLRRWRMEVQGPTGSATALGAIESEPLDVLVVERPSDEAGAHEACARLLDVAGARGLPVVSVARTPEHQPDEGMTLGAPVKVARLHDVLLERLGLAPPRERRVEVPATAEPRAPLSILVAEDNPVNRRIVLLMLERLGYSADVAKDGNEALSAMLALPYDVVLMDLQMPELDGLEVTRRVRAASTSAGPYIVALTASAMEGDRQRCIDGGMDDYLSKPVSRKALQGMLVRAAAAISTRAAGAVASEHEV